MSRQERRLAVQKTGTQIHGYLHEKCDFGIVENIWQINPTLAFWGWCEFRFEASVRYFYEVLSLELARLCYVNNHTPRLYVDNDCWLSGVTRWHRWHLWTYPRDEELPRLVEAHIPQMVQFLRGKHENSWEPPEERGPYGNMG